uniref:CSON002925 protein n=1 Tax=Culicoides sonorensis TaxID=179676 RepID=A0A336LIK9_CULSO
MFSNFIYCSIFLLVNSLQTSGHLLEVLPIEPRKTDIERKLTVLEEHGFSLGRQIGHGSYAKVKLAFSKEHNTVVAIKIISKFRTPKDYLKNFLPREIEVVRGLQHVNLIQFYQSIETTHRVFIIMEYAQNGSLLDLIRKEKSLSENRARVLFKQIVAVVEYIHSKGIVHRDIKCENLLFDKNRVLKLIDFGFARADMQPPNMSETYCGSYAYASPEILKGIPYQPQASDIWAIGVVLYAMIIGRLPFDDSSVRYLLKQVQQKVTYPMNSVELSTAVKSLIEKILAPLNIRATISIYCGKENCYDVLGVGREATKSEIQKAYRALARKYHPDLHKESDKATASENFKRIATAYEYLKDDDARVEYDYVLDHPEEYYRNFYRYYRYRYAKVDVRLVLIVTVSIISLIQYYSGWQRYETAIKYFVTVPKYRNKALEMIQQETVKQPKRTGKNRQSKIEQKEEQELLIRKVIEEKMDIKGAYAKPVITDILWVQLIISPYTITKYIIWYLRWIWKFTILRKEYGIEEKLYLIRKHLGMGQHQFDGIEDDKIHEYLELELWIKDNFKVWKAEQEEEMKKQMADNPRYKAYRRYMKNHGPGRMTFED